MNPAQTTIGRDDITCKEVVELITEYFEGALSGADLAIFEEHIGKCAKCTIYMDQIRVTIAVTGEITEDTIDPAARDELMSVFREWSKR